MTSFGWLASDECKERHKDTTTDTAWELASHITNPPIVESRVEPSWRDSHYDWRIQIHTASKKKVQMIAWVANQVRVGWAFRISVRTSGCVARKEFECCAINHMTNRASYMRPAACRARAWFWPTHSISYYDVSWLGITRGSQTHFGLSIRRKSMSRQSALVWFTIS